MWIANRRLAFALSVLLLTMHALPRGLAGEPKKIAFVVGVSKYHKDGLHDLMFADQDAIDLASELSKQGFAVTKLIGSQAEKATVDSRWKQFLAECQSLGKQDVVLVSFSGHGVQKEVTVPDGKLQAKSETPFFCVYDSQKTNINSMINLNSILTDLEEQSGSSSNLVLIDACRDNPDKGSKTLDGSTVRQLPTKISILFSSSPGMRSYESEELKHGVFTYVLLAAIRGDVRNSRGEADWLRLAAHVVNEVPIVAARSLHDPNIVQRPNLISNLETSPVIASRNAQFEKKLVELRRIIFHSRDPELAEAKLQELRREGAQSSELDFLDAQCQLNLERYPAVQYLASQLAHKDPDSVYAHLAAIAAASKQNSDPHSTWNFSTTRSEMERLEQHLLQAIRIAPAYEGTIEYVHEMWVSRKPEQYRDYFDSVIEKFPANALVYAMSGWGAKGGEEEVIKIFQKAYALDSNSAYVTQSLAHRFTHLQKYDEAIKYNDKAIRMSPKYAWPRLDKISTLVVMKKYEQAEEEINKFTENVNATSQHMCNIASSLTQMEKLDDAIVWYRRAIAKDPARMLTYESLAKLYIDMDNVSELKSLIDQFTQRSPSRGESHLLKCRIADKLGALEDAATEMRAALQYSESPSADMLIECAHYESLFGNITECLNLLKRAVQLDRSLSPKLKYFAKKLDSLPTVSIRNLETRSDYVLYARSGSKQLTIRPGATVQVQAVPYLGTSSRWQISPDDYFQKVIVVHSGFKNMLGQDTWFLYDADIKDPQFRLKSMQNGKSVWEQETPVK